MSRLGIALSGGGARAMAFHLGCMRALNDHGILSRASVLSAVSGGSVIAALYAYTDEPFDAFDERVQSILRKGLVGGIVRYTLASWETPKIVAAQLSSGVAASVGSTARMAGAIARLGGVDRKSVSALTNPLQAPIRRFASRSTAFERYLRQKVFGEATIEEVRRDGLAVVLNATELRTGTAFRYGSEESGCWRYGRLAGDAPHVSQAVAASACFPALLPSFDQRLLFENQGEEAEHRVVLTDGGVYDNLGISPLLPGRSSEFGTNAHDVDFIIACDAGAGIPSGVTIPFLWGTRMAVTVSAIHRRTQALSFSALHDLRATGRIRGFLLPYLGQIDERLPNHFPDLVPREAVSDYPTDFSPMSACDLELLSLRGEQITHILVGRYGMAIL